MKKLLLVLAVATFTAVACKNEKKEGEKTDTPTETPTTPTETTTPAQDTTAAVNPPAADTAAKK